MYMINALIRFIAYSLIGFVARARFLVNTKLYHLGHFQFNEM